MQSRNSSTPHAATEWQLRTCTLQFCTRPALMGIVNVTPDSFSDGGKFYTPSLAIEHALRLEDEGADILDIGGESTRPYSQSVGEDEELKRVTPVLEGIVDRVSIPISIDTSKARVARAAMEIGAEVINDVTGLEGDEAMVDVALHFRAGVCAMHMQGRPANMQDNPMYGDVVDEIYSYLERRYATLRAVGMEDARICLDPGIGFGKTHQHNVTLLKNAHRFLELGRPILVGHSRKGFIGKLIGDTAADRTAGNVGVSLAMAMKGIQVLRIHDVRATRDALACLEACL
jgi:dihydropteroate synthase